MDWLAGSRVHLIEVVLTRDFMYVNYAIHLPLIDMLMGTFKLPPKGIWPDEYGVMKLETVPTGLVAQALMPFLRTKNFVDYVGKEHAAVQAHKRAD